MNSPIEGNAYQQSYAGEFDEIIEKAERHARCSKRICSYKHLAYIFVIALSFGVYFLLRENTTFSLFGAAVIASATIVTGICLMLCFKSQNFFSSNDPAFGSRHIDRIKRMAQKEREGTASTGNDDNGLQYRERITILHSANRKHTSTAIQHCIIWEMTLVSVGTIVWGFWDVLNPFISTLCK